MLFQVRKRIQSSQGLRERFNSPYDKPVSQHHYLNRQRKTPHSREHSRCKTQEKHELLISKKTYQQMVIQADLYQNQLDKKLQQAQQNKEQQLNAYGEIFDFIIKDCKPYKKLLKRIKQTYIEALESNFKITPYALLQANNDKRQVFQLKSKIQQSDKKLKEALQKNATLSSHNILLTKQIEKCRYKLQNYQKFRENQHQDEVNKNLLINELAQKTDYIHELKQDLEVLKQKERRMVELYQELKQSGVNLKEVYRQATIKSKPTILSKDIINESIESSSNVSEELEELFADPNSIQDVPKLNLKQIVISKFNN